MVDDEDEDTEERRKAERMKRKERSRIVEYDPDLGETVVKHRRKSSRQAGWENLDDIENA